VTWPCSSLAMTCSRLSASRSFLHPPPDFFTEDTPTAVLVRQVLGAIARFEKASAVAKLAAARKRKREREGRCEGRKPLSETRPEVVALARKLRRRKPKAGRLSLRGVASELAARGFLNERGKPYAAKSIASMLCQDCC
jgi:DNA invertase Pin-like site-specific DNA recombinase